MSGVADWLNSSLKRIEHKYFKDVVRVDEVEKNPMGDGQFVIISDISRVNLSLVSKTGERRILKTILKLEPNTGPGKDMATSCEAFSKEIRMYREVLKSMERLISEKGSEKDFLWADCYHCEDNKFLFQDLCEQGYRVVPTHKFLDLEHALLVMKALGQFHAYSMVMKERGTLNMDDQFEKPYYARQLPFMDAVQKQSILYVSGMIKDKWGPQWASVPERLEKYLEKPGEVVYKAWNSTRGVWDVLNHGDFTMRNMLFHYQPGSDKPDAIKFVDFQMCHYSHLSNDLNLLLYSSIKPDLREKSLDTLLQTYLDSLHQTSRKFGFTGDLPTMNHVKSGLKDLAPLMVINVLQTLPFFILSGKDDIQKKADKYLKECNDCDEMAKVFENEPDPLAMWNANDPDVRQGLEYEMTRFMNENIF